MNDVLATGIEMLRAYPFQVAGAILVLTIAARLIHRVAMYAFMFVLIIVFGSAWTQQFMSWVD